MTTAALADRSTRFRAVPDPTGPDFDPLPARPPHDKPVARSRRPESLPVTW
ncbi:hypothetical protein ACFXAZ_24550 [Streptomyces sp. NPDC059477]|uniref:hypothetical protein n=1 Tax=Streptomyces sp. NPDC059477 TaxID=3346847 RepID=UPI0036978BE0